MSPGGGLAKEVIAPGGGLAERFFSPGHHLAIGNQVIYMKHKDFFRIDLSIEQLEETTAPLRPLLFLPAPKGGWIRATREALGMSGAQLAARAGMRASQSIEDIQASEADKSIKLKTLDQVARAMGCRLVYALVPEKPLHEIRRAQARAKALRKVSRTAHSMKLEDQGVGADREAKELERITDWLLATKPRRLWD